MARHESGANSRARFATTNWQIIAAAKGDDSSEARDALAELCVAYWYPLYAYLRRQGYPADEAQDLTQGCFAGLLERDFLKGTGPEKGRFRTFLLVSLKNHLSNQRERDRALKRGGGVARFTIDLPDAEGRYASEPAHGLTPERLFERRWALTLLESVLARLGAEMAAAGKESLFERLGLSLLGGGDAAPYSQIAGELGMTEGAAKVAAHRLRKRYRELIREEVARTVDSPDEVEEEIRSLFEALRR